MFILQIRYLAFKVVFVRKRFVLHLSSAETRYSLVIYGLTLGKYRKLHGNHSYGIHPSKTGKAP